MARYASKSQFDYSLDILFGVNPTGAIVDCGAFDGSTAIQIYDYTEGENTIYALECDNENFQRMIMKFCNRDGIIPINKGVWSSTKMMNVSGAGQDVFVQSNQTFDSGNHNNKIEFVALDDIIDEPVSTIVMDIEGSEAHALLGARRLIETYRPALAIRMYHREDDFIRIPMIIESMELNQSPYRFFLRYNGHYRGAADLTLYAV
jgi:FkbM family methyltransferase